MKVKQALINAYSRTFLQIYAFRMRFPNITGRKSGKTEVGNAWEFICFVKSQAKRHVNCGICRSRCFSGLVVTVRVQ